jgi:hypothetical protein
MDACGLRGCTVMQTNRTGRLLQYSTYREAAEENGVAWAICKTRQV